MSYLRFLESCLASAKDEDFFCYVGQLMELRGGGQCLICGPRTSLASDKAAELWAEIF